MQTITLNKTQLLPIVIENKQKHDNIYNAAVSGYWQKTEEILTDKLEKAKKQEQIDNYLGITFPVSHSDDYDRVIRMLELSVENKIVLNSNEFDSYVRNQWGWRSSFLATNSIYLSGYSATTGSFLTNNF